MNLSMKTNDENKMFPKHGSISDRRSSFVIDGGLGDLIGHRVGSTPGRLEMNTAISAWAEL